LYEDVTGKDEAVIAEAMVMAAAHWDTWPPRPKRPLSAARAAPSALYIAIKYLQSLSEEDERRINEYAMKVILLARYPDFVKEALAADPTPADL
jgi:hypothetical protein